MLRRLPSGTFFVKLALDDVIGQHVFHPGESANPKYFDFISKMSSIFKVQDKFSFVYELAVYSPDCT